MKNRNQKLVGFLLTPTLLIGLMLIGVTVETPDDSNDSIFSGVPTISFDFPQKAHAAEDKCKGKDASCVRTCGNSFVDNGEVQHCCGNCSEKKVRTKWCELLGRKLPVSGDNRWTKKKCVPPVVEIDTGADDDQDGSTDENVAPQPVINEVPDHSHPGYASKDHEHEHEHCWLAILALILAILSLLGLAGFISWFFLVYKKDEDDAKKKAANDMSGNVDRAVKAKITELTKPGGAVFIAAQNATTAAEEASKATTAAQAAQNAAASAVDEDTVMQLVGESLDGFVERDVYEMGERLNFLVANMPTFKAAETEAKDVEDKAKAKLDELNKEEDELAKRVDVAEKDFKAAKKKARKEKTDEAKAAKDKAEEDFDDLSEELEELREDLADPENEKVKAIAEAKAELVEAKVVRKKAAEDLSEAEAELKAVKAELDTRKPEEAEAELEEVDSE